MKKIKSVLLIFSITFICSCSLFKKAQAPAHSDTALSLSAAILSDTHNMYDSMKSVSDKSYGTWKPSYLKIEAEFQDLIAIDAARLNNTVILKLTTDWANRFATYESEHQSYSTLNNGQIISYQDFMDAAGNKVYKTEKNYK